jgi:enoyl-CoA hydratase/carnithine racemase
MTHALAVQREGELTIVRINRPERMNALDAETQRELAATLDQFESDERQRVMILTGEGPRAFCAGMDLKAVAESGEPERQLPPSGFGGLTSRYTLDKPVIAAVNGACVGGGFELALACDLIIAEEGARFGFPEPRVGTAALAGGLQRLPRQIGLKRAMDLILTARLVDAREGYELGFVSRVVPKGEALRVARQVAGQILELDPLAVNASKACVMVGLDESSLQAAIRKQFRLPAVKALRRSRARSEGPRAFAQRKRTPQQ